MNFTDLNQAKYIALETFRKNGQGVVTPVWQTPADGKLFVWTEAGSWKTKRIHNNKRVRVARCNARGNLESEWVEAQARLLNAPAEIETQRQRMVAKYGLSFKLINLMQAFLGHGKKVVVIEISPEGDSQ